MVPLFAAIGALSAQLTAQPCLPAGSGDVTAPEVVLRVEPEYAMEAARDRRGGTVRLGYAVNVNGRVQGIRVLATPAPSLTQSAIDALRQWRFRPGTKAGQPVCVCEVREFSFDLRLAPSRDKDGVHFIGGGVSAPALISRSDPDYPEAGLAQKMQGVVLVELVVNAAGEAEKVRVLRPIGFGFDEEAIKAVRRWKFRPARKDGEPVAVYAKVEVTFRLP